MTITTLGLTGFEHGYIGSGAQNGGGLFDAVPGSGWQVTTTAVRNGTYAARLIAPANTATRLVNTIPTTPTKIVVRFGVKVTARPSSGTVQLASVWDGVSTQPWILSISSAGVLSMLVSGGSAQTGPTIDTTSWHLIELQFDATADTMDWKVDGVLQTRATGTASAAAEFSLGTRSAAQPAFNADFDDVIIGIWTVAATDWYGDGKVLRQLAGSDGTHATITSLSPGDAATAYSGTVTTAYTMVDDVPGGGAWTNTRTTTDNLALRTATVGAYAEVKPATTAETRVANAVKAILSYSSSATQANLAACDVRNSAGAVTALWGLTGGVGADYSESTNFFKSAIVTAPAAGWTAAEVNAIRFRFGGCTSADISPVPTVQGLMLEVDWPTWVVPTATPVARVSLAAGATPATRTAHSVKVRARKVSGTGTVILRVDPYEGGTTQRGSLTSAPLTTSLADYTLAIPDIVAGAIGDYSNFELRFWAESSTGDAVAVEVARIALVAPAAAGPQTLFGSSSLATTFGSTTAARRRTTSAVVAPTTFGAVVQGRRKTFAQVTAPFTVAVATQGLRKAKGITAAPFTFGAVTQAQRRTTSALVAPFTFSAVTAGQRLPTTHYGVVARASTFGAVTQGQRKALGVVARATSFGVATQGQRKTFSSTAAPSTFAAATQAQRRTFSSTVTPVSFGAVTAGQATAGAQTYFGVVARATSFGAVTAGQRRAFGQVARPTSFGAVTAGQRKALGVVARVTAFGATTVGQRRTTSAIAAPSTFGAVTQGRRRTTSALAMPLSFVAVTAGDRAALTKFGAVAATYTLARDTSARRKTFASTATPLTLGIATAGQRIAFGIFGAVAAPFTFGSTTQGRRRTTSAIAASSTFGAVVQGRRRTTSALAMPVAYGAATAAQRRTTGVVARASTFGAVTAARKQTYGALVMPVAYGAAVKARIHTRSALVMPLTVGIATAGLRPAAGGYGAISAVYAFGSTTQARRKTFGQVARPSTFGVVTQAKRRTTSGIVMPVGFVAVTAAGRRTTSAVLVPVTFAAVTQAQRRTFGRVALPLSLALVTQARRQALGRVALPLAVAVFVRARRQTFAVVDLPLHLLITSRGRLVVGAVVLNDADMVYLSGQAASEVAVGAEEVWPE